MIIDNTREDDIDFLKASNEVLRKEYEKQRIRIILLEAIIKRNQEKVKLNEQK